jgi:hypothetical protein
MNFMERNRELLRHMLATIAYRGGKAIRNAPEDFGSFRSEGILNTPVTLLAHIGDLIEWAHNWSRGDEGSYKVKEPLDWNGEVQRFHGALASFDEYLASGGSLEATLEPLFQAPIADALTHIGQLALLRRMAGDPVAGEAYRLAEIVAGRVGPEQAKPGREFERDKGAIWRKRSPA